MKIGSIEEPKKDDAKGAKPVLPPEKVHNLLPTHTQDLSNNMDPDYPTFPQPIGIGAGRTAFYGQIDQQPHQLAQKHHHHKDIGDKNIEEHVHGFASEDRNVLPTPRPRQNVPYPVNGVFNPSWQWLDKEEEKAALAQHQHHHHHHRKNKDIGDKKIDPEVHGFASEDKNVLATPRPRQNVAYPINGFKNPEF